MKYIKTNEEFKFWDAIKSKVKGMFDNLDQKIADKISGKSTEMAKQKSKENKANLFNEIIESIRTDFKTDLENSKDSIKTRKTIKNTLVNIYATLMSIANSSGVKTLTPSNIFAKQFTFMGKIDPKNFDSSIDISINKYLLTLELSDEDKKLITKNKSIDQDIDGVKENEDIDDLHNEISEYIDRILNWVIKYGDTLIKGDGITSNNKLLNTFTQQMGSNNSKSEEKLLKYITNIKSPKQLASVRDTLVKNGVISSDDAKNMKF